MSSAVGGIAFTASSTTSSNFNYYPTTNGNIVVFFLQFDGAVTGLTVAPYYSGTSVVQVAKVGNFYCFVGVSSGANQYYWNIAWTGTATLGATIEEYKGATNIHSTNIVTNSGTSGTAAGTLTTDDTGGNMIVVGLGNTSSNAFTATTGTQQQHTTSGTCRVASLDNVDSSPGSLTCDATLTSSAWDSIAIELQYLIGAVQGAGMPQTRKAGQGKLDHTTTVAFGNDQSGGGPVQPTVGQLFPTGQLQ